MRLKDFNIVYQIARTELRVIFYSPVAWLILVVFAVQCGFSFCDVIWPAIKSQSLGYEVQALTGSVFYERKRYFPGDAGTLVFLYSFADHGTDEPGIQQRLYKAIVFFSGD